MVKPPIFISEIMLGQLDHSYQVLHDTKLHKVVATLAPSGLSLVHSILIIMPGLAPPESIRENSLECEEDQFLNNGVTTVGTVGSTNVKVNSGQLSVDTFHSTGLLFSLNRPTAQ